jgi:hypothetical protein
MKKKSYRNRRISLKPKISPCDLPSVPEAEEGLSGSADIGVGRGFALPGEPVMPAMHSEQEEKPVFLSEKRRKPSKRMNYDDLLELLINISDEMDKQEDVVLANFSDFLIKKIATQKSLDYSGLFRDLLIKIVESDIINQNEVLLKVTNQYNKLLKLHINLNNDILAAKREAFQGSVAKAKEYVG